MAALDIIRNLRTLSDAEAAAVSLWEQWVQSDIEAAARHAGRDPYQLDPVQVERFVIEACLYRLQHPDDATQVDVAVDDASVSRRYTSSTGQLTYLPAWWGWLGLPDPSVPAGAFTIRMSYRP